MAEPDRNLPSTSLSSINRESSDAAVASSSSNSNYSLASEEGQSNYHDHVHVHRDHLFQQSGIEQPSVGFSYRGNLTGFDDASNIVGDDTFSCIIVALTFCFFVSMTLILGLYGPASIRLGPNSSILINPNPLFVQKVKVQEVDKTKPGLKLYGLYKSPVLDNVTTWSENYRISVLADSHKEWIYFLNEGSQINISYSVKSLSSSVFLIIAQGTEGLTQWLENPTYPSPTLSWNIIRGSGVINQDIFTSSSYYVALVNLNSEEEVEVQLNLTVRAFLYNTTEEYYKCTFTKGTCSLSVLFPNGNAIVLTSSGIEQDTPGDDWYVRVSYGPRWLTYVAGIGGITVLLYVAFNILNKFQCTREDGTGIQYVGTESARAPLLSCKDDEISSWGSSYESISNDEDCLEEFWAASSLGGKSLRDGEDSNNTWRLCAICFDAPRDCFFLPCGHCVACFECGTRIAEAAGTCPVCRRNMKKVRKIFTV